MNSVELTKWIISGDTPEVKYRALTELLNLDKDNEDVKKAHDELINSEFLKNVMSKFESKNKWDHIDAFLILVELGLTREDVNIDKYVEPFTKKFNAGMKCTKILFLRNLVTLGYKNNSWVQEQISEAFSLLRDDGTVRCLDKGKKRNDSRLPEMGCYRLTSTYLLLAAELKKHQIAIPETTKLLEFYMSHNVIYHIETPETPIVKEVTETFFPIDHVHMGLQTILYALSILGALSDTRCITALHLLDSFKREDGTYTLSDSFEAPYMSVGNLGEANKWITLYAQLIKKYSIYPIL